MSSNSFVYLLLEKIWTPIHSYVCQFIRIFSLSKKNEPQFIRMTANYLPSPKKIKPQFIRMSSNSFVYLPLQKKLIPNSFVYLPIHSYIFPLKKIEPQFIRMFFKFIGIFLKKPSPNSFVYLPNHSYMFIRKKSQCAQQSVLLLSHSQSSGCHTVAVGIVTKWVVGFCPSLVTKWAAKLPGSRPLACHTESP